MLSFIDVHWWGGEGTHSPTKENFTSPVSQKQQVKIGIKTQISNFTPSLKVRPVHTYAFISVHI